MESLRCSVDPQRVNQEIHEILIENIKSFLNGESSTLTVEKTQVLLDSILYTIDLYSNHCREGFMDWTGSMASIYKKSLEYTNLLIEESYVLYEAVEVERVPVNNDIYRETFERSLPDFFSTYNPKFDAHNIVTTIDYPLLFDPMDTSGILYINKYLNKFRVENDFCKQFHVFEINDLVRNFYSKYHCRANDGYFNLFELVFKNYYTSFFIKDKKPGLILTQDDCVDIAKRWDKLSKKTYIEVSHGITMAIIRNLTIHNPALLKLIHEYVMDMSESFLSAIHHNNLNNFVIVVDPR